MTGSDDEALLAGVESVRLRNLAWCQVDLARPGVSVSALVDALGPVFAEFGPRRWWLVRKDPGVRVRIETLGAGDRLVDVVVSALSALGAAQARTYEPETYRFGGDEGMDIAHDHFALDTALAALLEQASSDVQPLHWSTVSLVDLSRRIVDDPAEWWDAWKQLESIVAPLAGEPPGPAGSPASALTGARAAPASRLTTGLEAGHRRIAERLRNAALEGGVGRRTWFAAAAVFHWNRLGFDPAQMAAVVAEALRVTTAPAQAATGNNDAETIVLHVELSSAANRLGFLVDEVGALVPGCVGRAAFVDLGDGRIELLLRSVAGDALSAWLAAVLSGGLVRSVRQSDAALCLSDGLVPAGAAFARYDAGLYECSERAVALLRRDGAIPPSAATVAELGRIHGEGGDLAASAQWHLDWLRALEGHGPWPDMEGGELLVTARLAHLQWLRLNDGAADTASEMGALGALIG